MDRNRALLIAGAVVALLLGVKLVGLWREEIPAPSQLVAPSASAPLDEAALLAGVFAGTKPGLVGLPADVQLGMTAADLAKASPELSGGGTTTPQGIVCVPEMSSESGRLEGMNMLLRADLPTAERALTTAWGAPVRGQDAPDKPAAFWHDEGRGVRAVLRTTSAGTHVEARRYQSMAALFGDKGSRFGFEAGGSVIGATIDELKSRFVVVPRAADASAGADVQIVLPPTEYGWRDTRLYAYLASGKIARFTVEIEYGRGPADTRAKILRAIDDKLGAADVIDAGALGAYRVYKSDRLIIARDESTFGAWHLSVEAADGAIATTPRSKDGG